MSLNAEDDYRAAGFSGRLPRGTRHALLIIDMVQAYLDPGCPLKLDGEAAVATSRRLLDAARAAGAPVVFTTVRYTPGGREGGLFYRKVPALETFVEGSPFGDFPPSLTPRPDELVVVKHYPSAFFGTSLASTLRVLGVDSVIVTGFSTSGCVRASALDALCHGFIPLVVADGCADRTADIHRHNLFDIANKIADVVALDEAVALMGRANALRASCSKEAGFFATS